MKKHLDAWCGKGHNGRCQAEGEGFTAGKGQQETSCSARGVRSQVSYRRGDNRVNKHLRPTRPQLFFKMMLRRYFLNASKIKPVKQRAALGR